MKFKNYDIILSQDLKSYRPISKLIHIERLTSNNPIELTTELVGEIYKRFFGLKEVVSNLSNQDVPGEITNIIDTFKNANEMTINTIENLTCSLKYFGYNLFIVGRLDLTDSISEIDINFYQRSYLLNGFIDNSTSLSSVYSGYSLVYSNEEYPYAFDYIKTFNLNSDQMELFELQVSQESYRYLSSSGNLRSFDDSAAIDFIRSRNYKYLILFNPA